MTGDILYNGRSLDQFVPERSASYISQVDLHYGEGLGLSGGTVLRVLTLQQLGDALNE